MEATQVLMALDAMHESRDRLHDERIGWWHRERRARLRQFRRLAGRTEQAVMADTLEALNALQCITGFMQSFILCGVDNGQGRCTQALRP